MPSVLILCPYPEGVAAGQRLKYEQYFDDWRAHGWDVTVSPYMNRAMWDVVHKHGNFRAKIAGMLRGHVRRLRDMARLRDFDLVYVFMYVTPIGTTWLERLTRARARVLVYDIEDNLLTSDGVPRGFRQWLKGRGKPQFLLRRAERQGRNDADLSVGRYRQLPPAPRPVARGQAGDRLDRHVQLAPVSRPAAPGAAGTGTAHRLQADSDRQF
jgi:hypothetical protein